MEETLSIIKYRPLEGCEDQFEEELKKLTEINKASGFADKAIVKFTKLDDGSYVQIMICPNMDLSLIHISEPTRRTPISYAVFCLKKKKS